MRASRSITCLLAILIAANALIARGDATTPHAAPELSVIGVGSQSVQLVWTDNSSNQDSFDVDRCTAFDGGCVSWEGVGWVGAGETPYFSDDYLTPSTYYEYRVRGSISTTTSNIVGATTNPLPPPPPPTPVPAPTNLMATVVSHTQIDLSWTSSGGEAFVAVYMCPREIADWCFTESYFQGVQSQYTALSIRNLDPGQRYYFRLAANGDGSNGYSNVAEATTPAAPPPQPPQPPSDLVATPISMNRIDLVWRDNASNEKGFEIERCTEIACASILLTQTVTGGIAAYSEVWLTANTTYQYRVRAFNDVGPSAFSNIATAKTREGPPAAPSSLTTSLFRNSEVDLRWNDNSDNEADFVVERCTGALAVCADANFGHAVSVGANGTTYRDATVARRTTYTYRVRARHRTEGDSAWSNVSTITTK